MIGRMGGWMDKDVVDIMIIDVIVVVSKSGQLTTKTQELNIAHILMYFPTENSRNILLDLHQIKVYVRGIWLDIKMSLK